MAVAAGGDVQLTAQIGEKVCIVEIVREARDAVAVELQGRDRPDRLSVEVLVPVQEEPPTAMQTRLDPRRRLGQRAFGELRVEDRPRLRVGEALETEEHAR